jgi:hypothetical protein
MNTSVFIIAVLVGVLQSVAADSVPAKTDSPPSAAAGDQGTSAAHITFDQTSFDFGKVESGEPVKHTFFFTNSGNHLLEIREVRPSCGCTAAGAWDKQVEPGKYGTIPVQFNSMGYGGMVHKTVTVVCNDPANSNAVLQITGTVWKPIDVLPAIASFSFGPDVQSNDTRSVRIVSNLTEPLTVSDAKSSDPAFQAELKTVKEGKEYELRVTVVTPLNLPNISAQITLKTSYPKMPVLSVTAFAMVQAAVTAIPMQLMLPLGPLTNSSQFTVTLQNNSTNSLVLSEPKVNVDGVEANLKEIQPGKRFELNVTFPSEFQNQTGHSIEVAVKSNFPQLPVVKVPVFQATAPPKPVASAPAPNPGVPAGPKLSAILKSAPEQAPPSPAGK